MQPVEIQRTIVKPHWCRKMRGRYRSQESRYLQRRLCRCRDGSICRICGAQAYWYVVKLHEMGYTTSKLLCDDCMNKKYERCKSHQIIETRYASGRIEKKDKYCTVVYPRSLFYQEPYPQKKYPWL